MFFKAIWPILESLANVDKAAPQAGGCNEEGQKVADKSSGLDALLEALKQSGVDFDKGKGPSSQQAASDSGKVPRASKGSAGGSGSGKGRGTPHRPAWPGSSFPFAQRMGQFGRRTIIIGIVVLVVVIVACYWWFHPPINIHSADTWYFIAIFILLPIFLALYTRHHAYLKGSGRIEQDAKKAKTFKWLAYIPVAVVALGIIGAIASMPVFPGNAQKYANILPVEKLDFASDIKEVDYSQVPVIDRDSATILGNRTMGTIPEYVSQFEISPLYSQINYQQTPVRVSPLVYADIFKWWNNRKTGIPAYVLVDMTTQDTKIVKPQTAIFYSQSEPLERNIDRYVQLKYPFYMFDQKSFEIDDEGNPWWICPVKEFTVGLFGGQTISRAVLCNASTGECTDLPVDQVPQWVDRVYPAELLIQQYNWGGSYAGGWLNSWLGQTGVFQTTPGTNGQLGYNYLAKDDDVWVYSGVTSATADNSIIGFVLVNQRTAEARFYAVAGATEESAMTSAEGQVQHLRYSATFPILLNINNQPTYFMALKDDAGLVKMYAMLDIQRYQNVAVGDTVVACQQAYKQLLATNGVLEDASGGDLTSLQASGTIAAMTQVVVDGNSHFYVQLVGDMKIYDFALPGMLGIINYQAGDSISFSYLDAVPACIATAITSSPPNLNNSAPGAGSAGGSANSADNTTSASSSADNPTNTSST